ncbi:Phage integrase family protein [compost metagenome]
MRSFSSYLIRRNQTYYLKVTVPKSVQHLTARREIVKSLGTDSLSESRDKVMGKRPLIKRLKAMNPRNTTTQVLQELFDELTDFDNIALHGRYQYEPDTGVVDPYLAAHIGQLGAIENLMGGGAARTTDEDFWFTDVRPDYSNKKQHMLFEELYAFLLDMRIKKMTTGTHREQLREGRRLLQEMLEEVNEAKPAYLLSQAWGKFYATNQEKWVKGKSAGDAQKVLSDWNGDFKWMMLRLSDIPVTDVTSKMVKNMLGFYESRPDTRFTCEKTGSAYKRMPIEDVYTLIVDGDIPEEHEIGGNTLMRFHMALKDFFEWLVEEDEDSGIATNPALGFRFKFKESDIRTKFTNEEIRKFEAFALEQREPWKKWVILLAIYTGARLGDIKKIMSHDAKAELLEDSGVKYYRIKYGKTKAAIRNIPIPKKLLDYGILDALKKPMFTSHVSNYFPRWREKIGIPDTDINDRNRTFHSFRHSFKSQAAITIKDQRTEDTLMGHEPKGSAGDKVYLTYDISVLKEAIDKVHYE